MNPIRLLTSQKFVSTKDFQTKFAEIAKEAEEYKLYFRVMKHGHSVGVFLPNEFWEDLLEDLEALSSPSYLQAIKESREEVKKGQVIPLEKIMKESRGK